MDKGFGEDGMSLLLEGMILGNPSKAIENQEARGQTRFVNSECLPKRCNDCSRANFEKMGIGFGEDVDALFVNVTLPAGWKKVPTDHPMWSKLVDEQGRERASMFYKAAYYDRDAFICITKRFSIEPTCGWEDDNYQKGTWHCVVKDCDRVIWKSTTVEPEPILKELWGAWYDKKEHLRVFGEEWLKEHYPNWEDPCAYWELPFKKEMRGEK